MSRVKITLACGDYDRTRPLIDGTVVPEGIDLNYLVLEPEETFWRMLRHRDFDVSEMSLAMYAMGLARGPVPFVAIPVFPSRFFRHSALYVLRDSGIEQPGQLVGRRVGVAEYQMTAAVWVRGILKDEYRISPEQIEWVVGGQEQPNREEKVPFEPLRPVHIERAPEGRSLNRMLLDGEIAALLAARTPSIYGVGDGPVRRLFANCRQVEQDYFRRTGIFPIMHTLAIREDVYKSHPWVVQSLMKAFTEAKKVCYSRAYNLTALRYVLPWTVDDVEEMRRLMGDDPWPYGMDPNRKTLEKLAEYLYDQGLAARKIAIDELFAPNGRDSFKI